MQKADAALRVRAFAFPLQARVSARQSNTVRVVLFLDLLAGPRLNAAEFLGSESYATLEIEGRGGGSHGQRSLDRGLSSGPHALSPRSLARGNNQRSFGIEERTHGQESVDRGYQPCSLDSCGGFWWKVSPVAAIMHATLPITRHLSVLFHSLLTPCF